MICSNNSFLDVAFNVILKCGFGSWLFSEYLHIINLCSRKYEYETILLSIRSLFCRYSLSINGHILDQLGEGVEEAGGYYSQLVQEYDAIILSPTTVTEKFSFPASQEPGANQPLHILIAKSPISPNQIPIPHTEATSKVIIFADNETAVEPEMVQKGIETVVLDQINLNAVLEYCKRQGLCSILLDLRGNFGYFEDLLKQSLEENLLQKVVVEVLPFWSTNEEEGLPLALKNLRKGIRLKNITSRNSNDSVVLEGYP